MIERCEKITLGLVGIILLWCLCLGLFFMVMAVLSVLRGDF